MSMTRDKLRSSIIGFLLGVFVTLLAQNPRQSINMLLLSSPVHTAATPTVPGELLSSLTRQQRNWIANGTAPLFQLKRSTLLKEVPVNHLLSTTSSPVTKKVFVSRGGMLFSYHPTLSLPTRHFP